MKESVLEKYMYNGLGFPVELSGVPQIKIDDEYYPQIDVQKVSDTVIQQLIVQKERLTGNQIKFIRKYFSMTLREFGSKVVSVSQTAVRKWEGCGNNAASLDINIEKILRMYIYERVCATTKKKQSEFFDIYLNMKNIYEKKAANPMRIAYAA